MIGYLSGEVVFSDGKELILRANDGVGYQIYLNALLVEGSTAEIFVAHIYKDSGQELFGFETLREKKLFEMLNSVKGVGPKSAFSLISALGTDTVIQSVQLENKKTLSKAPGIGAKAAAQICLDLSKKIQNILMYSGNKKATSLSMSPGAIERAQPVAIDFTNGDHILEETLMACKELGFKEDIILAKAQKILNENEIKKPEQLVHLVLKEV